jgi:hypothetical protein
VKILFTENNVFMVVPFHNKKLKLKIAIRGIYIIETTKIS